MNTVDPRSQRARQALMDAAYKLTSTRRIDDISITELANEAGVSRPTLYQHYGDIPTLVAHVTEVLFEETVKQAEADIEGTEGSEAVRRLLHSIVNGMMQHRPFFRHALNGPSLAHIAPNSIGNLRDLMLRHSVRSGLALPDTREESDMMLVILGGVLCLLINWVSSDDAVDLDADQMGERLYLTFAMLTHHGGGKTVAHAHAHYLAHPYSSTPEGAKHPYPQN